MQNSASGNYVACSSVLRGKRQDNERTVPDATHVIVRENTILMEVGQCSSLFDECRGEAMRIRLVVSELRVDEIVNLLRTSQSEIRGI